MAKKKKDDADLRVTLTVTEQQLRLINNALEIHFRLCMGQFYVDLVDDLCLQNVQPEGENGRLTDEQFDAFIHRRDAARDKLHEFFDICFDREWRRWQKTPDMQTEIDLWLVIRHWMWEQRDPAERGNGTDSYTPMQFGPEPLAKIRLEDGEAR